MTLSNDQKEKIRQEVIEFANRVTRGNTVITDYWKGEVIRTETQLKRLYKKLMKVEEFAFDTEFTSLRMQYEGESDLVGVSFSWGIDNNYYVPVGHLVEYEQIDLNTFKKYMKKVFARKDVRIVGHNLKAELHALANVGIEVATNDLFDTIVAVWDINENEDLGLKEVTRKYYGYNQRHFDDILLTIPKEVKLDFGLKASDKGDASLVEIKYLAPYAMDDTFWTWQIYLDIQDDLEKEGVEKYFYSRQMPYVRVLFNMERRGVKVDVERLKKMSKMAEKDLAELEYKIFELAGVEFNVSSGQHLAEILFGWEKKKPVYKTILEPVIDSRTGEQEVYKSGVKKGQPKWKEIKTKEIIGYEFSGNKHLIENSFRFPVISTTETGIPKTGANELEVLAKKQYKRDKRRSEGIEMVKLILRYKKLHKLKTAFIDGLLEHIYSDGKIHCSFNQTGTTSGRLSCNSPNLQQLPRALEEVGNPPSPERFESEDDYKKAYAKWEYEKAEYDFWSKYEIRSVFIPEDEDRVIVAADFSNLEMRILTHFSQDPLLIDMFARDADAHGDTAKNMFKLDCDASEVKKLYPHLRQRAKAINFLLVYGGSAIALSQTLDVSKQEGQELYDLYFDTYKGVKKYMTNQRRFAHKNEYVYTILGRKRHLEGINGTNYAEVGYLERLAINAPIQGSAADIAISAQLLIENDPILKELGYMQLIQIHDELVGSCPRENVEKVGERVKYLMENCLPKPMNNIKLKVDWDWGESYASAK